MKHKQQNLIVAVVVVVVFVPPIYPIPNTVLRRTYPDPNPDRMPPVVCLREVLVVSFLRRVCIYSLFSLQSMALLYFYTVQSFIAPRAPPGRIR